MTRGTVALLAVLVACGGGEGAAPPGDVEPPPPPPPPARLPDGAQLEPIAQSVPNVYDLALDATHVYWVTNPEGDGDAAIWRAPRDASGNAELLWSGTQRVYAIEVDEARVFFAQVASQLTTGGRIWSLPKHGGEPELLALAWNPTSIALDRDHVYSRRRCRARGPWCVSPRPVAPSRCSLTVSTARPIWPSPATGSW